MVATLALVASPAAAADRSQFDPGNIIDDAVLYDGGSMDVAQVQAFIEEKGRSCRPGNDGTPCLKDYRQDTWTRNQTGCSGTYQGASAESAAQIVVKVARACGINPRALLVLLQKEQSLLTASGSTLYATRYRSATGFGCPDTRPCDAEYYGFFNQVYLAARQLRLYAANPQNYAYRAGRTNEILFHPNAACGRQSVYVRNTATAGLYNYTPYQPNAAVLAGRPDSCSSYGNLNFWSFYTDWFGSTHSRYAVTGDFLDLWSRLGYASSPLGAPTWERLGGLRDGGSFQPFERGFIYSSPATGTHYVTSAYDAAWPSSSRENGPLGYPVTDPLPLRSGGSFQTFQGGAIYSSPRGGTHAVLPRVDAVWPTAQRENGPLGFPLTPLLPLRDGASYQGFEGGGIYLTRRGDFVVPADLDVAWPSSQRENGPLGLPTSSPVTDAAGVTTQTFEGGVIRRAAPGAQPFAFTTAMLSAWQGLGGTAGALGAPLSSTLHGLRDGGTMQVFAGGYLYGSARGTFSVRPEVDAVWPTSQRENGPLGYPTSELTADGRGGWVQRFEGGRVLRTSSTAPWWVMPAAIGAVWDASAATSTPLGQPTSTWLRGLRDGGSYQAFERGAVYSSPRGTYSVSPQFDAVWPTSKRENGPLGYPVSPVYALRDGGSFQAFEGGAIYSSGAGTFAVPAAVDAAWPSTQRENGPLGYPVSAATTDASGTTTQRFEGGRVVVTRDGRAFAMTNAIATAWDRAGGATGQLGLPTSPVYRGLRDGGSFQTFERGSVYASPAGAFPVSPAFDAAWPSALRENGPLGYPTSAATTSASGVTTQTFEGGRLVQRTPGGPVEQER